jgi:tetratricopeptide (TPR) repeat protein
MRITVFHAILLAALWWPSASFAEVCDDTEVTYRERAASLYARGELSAAVAQLEKAIVRCPKASFYLLMLGNASFRAGNLSKAVEAYNEFLRQRPQHFEARMSLGFTLSRLGNPSGALSQWMDALRLEPSSPFARAALAVALFDIGDCDNAVIQFGQAVSLDTQYADSRNLAIDIRWDAEMRRRFDEVKRFARGEGSSGPDTRCRNRIPSSKGQT